MPPSRARMRPAFSLAELAMVLAIVGLLSLVALGPVRHYLDRLASRGAVTAAALLVGRARDEAVAQHTTVTLLVDSAAAALVLRARGETLATLPLGGTYGVTLHATRDSIAFDARGLGYGAANMTLIVRRAAAANTLVVSRLGRVRY